MNIKKCVESCQKLKFKRPFSSRYDPPKRVRHFSENMGNPLRSNVTRLPVTSNLTTKTSDMSDMSLRAGSCRVGKFCVTKSYIFFISI